MNLDGLQFGGANIFQFYAFYTFQTKLEKYS